MEVSYKKDGINNAMIIMADEEIEKDYKLQMVINNNIDGILPVAVKSINGKTELYYNITSKISMENMFATRKINSRDIEAFVESLNNVANNLKQYLLNINKIIFDMDMIYVDSKTGKYYFCYYPNTYKEEAEKNSNENMGQEGLKELFVKILEKLDHKDKAAVISGYGLQQMLNTQSVTVAEMMEYVKSNKAAKKNGDNNSAEQWKEKSSEYIYEKENNKVAEDEIYRTESKKRNKDWWKFWKRKKYKGEDELEEFSANELPDEDDLFLTKQNKCEETEEKEYEDATVLLTMGVCATGIILRSTDIENPITIIPNGFPCIIGKSARSADYKLEDQFISRVHARLYEEEDGYYIEDLNSSNGTYINGEKLKAHVQQLINIGDKITLANLEFIVE